MNTNTGQARIGDQERILLEYLQEHRSVTRLSAASKLGIANAPEIVRRLKNRGYAIEKEWCERIGRTSGRKVRYAKYFLVTEDEE